MILVSWLLNLSLLVVIFVFYFDSKDELDLLVWVRGKIMHLFNETQMILIMIDHEDELLPTLPWQMTVVYQGM